MKRSFFQALASFFALYGILFIPFPFFLTRIQYPITDAIFGKLIGFISSNLFGKTLQDTRVYSDSMSMYILVLILIILSFITALIIRWRKWQAYELKLSGIIYTVCFYYLALQLLKYGFDKVFKNQFYLPEPNILFTPVGRLDKDILYWTLMGTSHFYSVFMGVLEVLAAGLLIFRKTRLIGLLVSMAILINVVAVNLGFDIGVKLFSFFLLFLTIFLLVPFARNLSLILTNQAGTLQPAPSNQSGTFPRFFLKWFIVGLMLVEVLFPFFKTMNFNGDLAKRPNLHGAYQVEEMIIGNDTMSGMTLPVKRLFIHSGGYLIFEDIKEKMQDYKLSYNTNSYQYLLTDYQLREIPALIQYNEKDSLFILRYRKGGDSVQVKARSIDWRSVPALKKGFQWITD